MQWRKASRSSRHRVPTAHTATLRTPRLLCLLPRPALRNTCLFFSSCKTPCSNWRSLCLLTLHHLDSDYRGYISTNIKSKTVQAFSQAPAYTDCQRIHLQIHLCYLINNTFYKEIVQLSFRLEFYLEATPSPDWRIKAVSKAAPMWQWEAIMAPSTNILCQS